MALIAHTGQSLKFLHTFHTSAHIIGMTLFADAVRLPTEAHWHWPQPGLPHRPSSLAVHSDVSPTRRLESESDY